MNKKKIIIFMYSLGGGGIQRFVMNLVKNINKDEFEISIALVNNKGIYTSELPEEVKVIDLRAKRVHFSLIPLLKSLKKEQPDILFCIGTTINIVGILAKIMNITKCKLIIRQAVDFNDLSTSKLTKMIIKILYPKVDKCIVLTNTMKNNLINFVNIPKDKVEIVYNSINIDDINIRKKESIEDFYQNIREPKIITVGRLTKQKNQIMLIDAFKMVLKEKKAKLIIIGEGEDRDKIARKIKEENLEEDVLMLGYKSNPYKYLYNSEIFVLPSVYEGLSNALLEALTCDIPIVTTDNPDLIIKDGINGFQASVNENDIADKLLKLLSNKSMCETIIQNNEEYRNSFAISRMISSYEEIFKNAIKKR